MELLSKIQRLFLNVLLGVKNCPSSLILWDLGMMDMQIRILREKLILYHHISCLPKTAIAHQIMKTQDRLNFPSLRQEILPFLAKFGVSDVTNFSKQKWQCFVKEAALELNRQKLIENFKSYKKLDFLELSVEEFGIKD